LFLIRLLHLATRPRRGIDLTRTRRLRSQFSSPITFATLTCSSAAYSARAFGPRLFFRHDIPVTELERIDPGSKLPGRLVALYDGRGRNETPLWLPQQGALVFADGLTAPPGELRVWTTP
jgi:hypothetical protein